MFPTVLAAGVTSSNGGFMLLDFHLSGLESHLLIQLGPLRSQPHYWRCYPGFQLGSSLFTSARDTDAAPPQRVRRDLAQATHVACRAFAPRRLTRRWSGHER